MLGLKLNFKTVFCVFLKTGKTELRDFKRSPTIFGAACPPLDNNNNNNNNTTTAIHTGAR